MKNKFVIYLAVAALILASLACSDDNPPVTSVSATIDTRVSESINVFETPENWNVVPESCEKNLVRLILTGSTDSISASATLFQKSVMQKNGQLVYLYHFLAANHSVLNTETQSLRNDEIKYVDHEAEHLVGYLGYSQIFDNSQNPTDIAILSTISLENIDVTPSQITSKVNLTPNSTEFFFVLGYPKPDLKQNYIVAVTDNIVIKENKYKIVTMRQINEVSAVNLGSSGGPVCNQNGEIIGTLKSIYTTNVGIFDIEPNPDNIQEQINTAINYSTQTMISNGYSLQQ